MKQLFAILPLFLTTAALRAEDATVTVDPTHLIAPVSPYMTGSCMEDVNHEIYGGIYNQMVFGESFQEPEKTARSGVSGCWTLVQRGSALGGYTLVKDDPFVGAQSQRVMFTSGEGALGVANLGLGAVGMHFAPGHSYQVTFWIRTPKAMRIGIGVAAKDGSLPNTVIMPTRAGGWRKIETSFRSFPVAMDGRLEITANSPGTLDIGYVYFEGSNFKGHPERRDVADKLVEQGVTVMRYGGSMINAPEYRWKKMIGPRAKRPPYHGTWYPYASNGWGIPDFCAFCDAAGFLGIPAFNMGESPQDMADFIDYAHGWPDTKWGAQRYADGHEVPFKVHIIELGNEEQVNEAYWQKFEPIARAIWSRDPKMILTVGDFHYDNVITDPFHFTGGAVDTLAAHQKILALAKEYGAEVWFDVHLNTQEIPAANALDPLLSYIHALQRLSNGAKFHVVTYELNANTHDLTRALANAKMIGMIERAGAEPVVTSANALQVDGQNDNGWNQGLLFMNPEKVWLQPPGYVTQMMSRNRLANVVQADCTDPNLDVTATASADGKSIALQVVNSGDAPKSVRIKFAGRELRILLKISELSGALNAVNTAVAPETIKPSEHLLEQGILLDNYTFAPHSFTVLGFQGFGMH